MKKLLPPTILTALLYACQNDLAQAKFVSLKSDLESCLSENKEFKNNSKKNTFIRTKVRNFRKSKNAEKEYFEFTTKFVKTPQDSIAEKFIQE